MRRLLAPRSAAVVFLLYLAVSLIYFGRPVLGHLGSVAVAHDEVDSSQYMWFLSWWPWAILHGHNPFFEHVALVPGGYNLAWATSLAVPSLALSPITLAFGPVVAYNVFALLAPPLSAVAAFALCRHVTRSFWPAVAGGFVYGSSGYVLFQAQGAPWLVLVPFIPVAVLLFLKHLEGSIGDRRYVVLLGLAIALEFGTATEIVATTTLFGALTLALAYALFPGRRPALRRTAFVTAFAFAAAGIVVLPFLVSMLHHHEVPNQAVQFSKAPTDPFSIVVPTDLQFKAATQIRAWGKLGVPGGVNCVAYLGLPLVLILLAWAVGRRRERTTWLLGITFLGLVLANMGKTLLIAGHDTHIALPWRLMGHVPLFEYALPPRFAVYPSLVAALILSLWIARRGPAWRWAIVGVALVALLPHLSSHAWHSDAYTPAFFKHDRYKAALRPTDNVIIVPVIGANQRWQAETHFGYRMVGGYLGAFPKDYTRFAAWTAITSGVRPPDWRRKFDAYVRAKHATAIVVDKRYKQFWTRLFAPLGYRPTDTGQVLFYRLAPAPRS